jgi:hypothetical protein
MKPKTHLLTLLGLLSTALASAAAEKFTVTAANDPGLARPAEMIAVPWTEIISRLPGALPDHVTVRDAKGQVLPSQYTNFQPEMREGHVDDFLFQHDFAAGEKSATFTIEKTVDPVPPFPQKTFARYVPERFDDFAWENDLVGHRTYGQALDSPAAGGSRLATNGIDIWCKRVPYLIVDRWYLRGHNNYHKDTGEGLDAFGVGPTTGCGGTGVWDGSKLYPAHNWKTSKVLANGPIRTVFELGYEEWDAGGLKITETKRFIVDAGKYLDEIQSTFTFTGPAEITAAIGLVRQEKPKAQVFGAKLDEKAGWLGQWETYEANGQIGCGIVLQPGTFAGSAQDDRNHLILVKAKSGKPMTYFAGGCWGRAGRITTAAAWEAYLTAWSARLKSPVKITFGTSN